MKKKQSTSLAGKRFGSVAGAALPQIPESDRVVQGCDRRNAVLPLGAGRCAQQIGGAGLGRERTTLLGPSLAAKSEGAR
jgi:hypothetical protein